uniref:Uncharacterized protein n=1 Tax=Setaria digitata TaxID=48799 RepID=A0A915PNB7_9BILA
MTKDDIMIEWRKQRGAAASSSEIGRRPLHDNSSANNSEEYQPSSEPGELAESFYNFHSIFWTV